MHGSYGGSSGTKPAMDPTSHSYYEHSSGQRINTDAVLVESLRRQYPKLTMTVVESIPCNLLSYAQATGLAKATPLTDMQDVLSTPLMWTSYSPPASRLDGAEGAVVNRLQYGKFQYSWKGHDFIMYIANGRDGMSSYPSITNQYLLGPPDADVATLVRDCGMYMTTLHEEIWVFDGGIWQKDAALYKSVRKAFWKDVILDDEMKQALQQDVNRFFDSREKYADLRVPWKRGAIYYGPPGNGKTISIKATMNTLYSREKPIPSLYVKSLSSFSGPEFSIKQIFMQARQEAPCLLIFEDLDSLITDAVRSYLYNEMDGLRSNDGVLIVGSTNHLDRLDPGMSKRPSRFDRKFEFPKPNMDQRVQYAAYWREKLSSNKELEFPAALCPAIAGITDDFSFAYMQEAFVASLLAIAAGSDSGYRTAYSPREYGFEKLVLWREMKRQVKILRGEL